MLILKRLVVWSFERLVEANLLGGLLLGCLLAVSSGEQRSALQDSFAGFWAITMAVAVFLFSTGYYVTTACFGVVWRSSKTSVYPTITAALFIIHTSLIFANAGNGFTPEARKIEPTFALGGAVVVFCCSLGGNGLLSRRVGLILRRTHISPHSASLSYCSRWLTLHISFGPLSGRVPSERTACLSLSIAREGLSRSGCGNRARLYGGG